LVKRFAKRREAKELAEHLADEDTTLASILDELSAGKPAAPHAFAYRRALEVIGPVIGMSAKPAEVVLPDRGYHSLTSPSSARASTSAPALGPLRRCVGSCVSLFVVGSTSECRSDSHGSAQTISSRCRSRTAALR
jgi:hypothetical protein